MHRSIENYFGNIFHCNKKDKRHEELKYFFLLPGLNRGHLKIVYWRRARLFLLKESLFKIINYSAPNLGLIHDHTNYGEPQEMEGQEQDIFWSYERSKTTDHLCCI